MTTLWNYTTKQQLFEALEEMKAAVTKLAAVTPSQGQMPMGVDEYEVAVYGDLLIYEAKVANIIATMDELVKVLPGHAGKGRKA